MTTFDFDKDFSNLYERLKKEDRDNYKDGRASTEIFREIYDAGRKAQEAHIRFHEGCFTSIVTLFAAKGLKPGTSDRVVLGCFSQLEDAQKVGDNTMSGPMVDKVQALKVGTMPEPTFYELASNDFGTYARKPLDVDGRGEAARRALRARALAKLSSEELAALGINPRAAELELLEQIGTRGPK